MTILDIGLYLFYALMIVSLIAMIVFPILNAIKDTAALKKSLIGVGGLVLVFFASYLLSGSGLTLEHRAMGITEGQSKLIGTGITMMYIAFFVTIIVWIYAEISKAFK